MTGPEEWPEPTHVEPAPAERQRRPHWQPKPRNVLALDRHIAQVYGPEHVAGSRR